MKYNSIYYLIILCLVIPAQSQFSYSLEDVNPNSTNYGNYVGPSYFEGRVILHYFGSFTWNTCTTRFGELNDIYENLRSQGYLLELVGISKSLWSSGLSNWVNQGSAAICIDESPYQVWNDWDASQRDLFITDKNGLVVYQQNITSGISNDIYDIIFNYLETKDVSTPYKINLHQNYPNPVSYTHLRAHET